MRVTLQALAIVLSGAQAVHTMSWDEALGLPSEESVLLALRTQQILAHESGVARTADPLGGSYYVESLTDELDRRASSLMAQIEEHGGVVAGIEDGSLERAIAESAYEQQRLVESGERVIVGVNRFAEEGAESRDAETFTVGPDVLERQLARLERTRQSRDDALVRDRLRALKEVADGQANTMPAIVEAVRAEATVGEISRTLEASFGRHQPASVI
jgi:methylmalonyl-CoA mutase N-terminal domain/subunit